MDYFCKLVYLNVFSRGVERPEDGVNDAETRRSGMRPYLHVSQVHLFGDMNVQLI